MDKLKAKKLNRWLVVLVLAVCVMASAFCVGCVGDDDTDSVECTEHNFVKVEGENNKAPTYDADGRELRACTQCGITAYFVLPKLQKTDGTESPEYIAILDSYVVSYGETLEEVATKYFTTGWAFVLDKETTVGDASESGYDFAVKFTPSDSAYSVVNKTIKLVVKKAQLKDSDITYINPINIPSSINSLDEMPLVLSDTQKIKGTIAWAEGQEIMRNQSADYTYIFTPEDTNNYEIFVGTIRLNA